MRHSVKSCESADLIVSRLEAAGATLLALPNRGHPQGIRCGWPEVVRDFREAYGWLPAEPRARVPTGREIDEMDEALGWITLIPPERYVLRRIVGARALVSPRTQRHLFSWRRIAGLIGADHKAVQRWHEQGIGLIDQALRSGEKSLAQTGQKMACISA